MIYLASPYSHPDSHIMSLRHDDVSLFTAQAMIEGHIIFSPIVYGHTLAVENFLPTDARWWKEFNEAIIRACSEMWVLRLDGWQESKGVQMEIAYAKELGLPVLYKDL